MWIPRTILEKASKSAQEQEDRRWRRKRQSPTCCRDSGPKERKVEKLRVRDRAKCATQTASERQATLQSLWKKGKRNLRGERNEVTADERQTDSWKLRERQQTRTNQHVKLAVETQGEITLKQGSTNQCEWLAVETPDERELRFNRVLCREQHMLPQLPLFQQCSIQSQDVMQTWLHWTRQHAQLVHKDFLALFHPKPNECLHALWFGELCTYTVVTDPCHIPPFAQARPMMLCIYTTIRYNIWLYRMFVCVVYYVYVVCAFCDVWTCARTLLSVSWSHNTNHQLCLEHGWLYSTTQIHHTYSMLQLPDTLCAFSHSLFSDCWSLPIITGTFITKPHLPVEKQAYVSSHTLQGSQHHQPFFSVTLSSVAFTREVTSFAERVEHVDTT